LELLKEAIIMIKTEYYSIRSDGVKLYRTYSAEGKMIERDGVMYAEAIDPEGVNRVYTETDIDNEADNVTAEEALSIITGGEV